MGWRSISYGVCTAIQSGWLLCRGRLLLCAMWDGLRAPACGGDLSMERRSIADGAVDFPKEHGGGWPSFSRRGGRKLRETMMLCELNTL